MKRFLLAALMTTATAGALAQVGVSVSVGQPGFYGHLDIGGYPPPALLYPQPLVIGPAPVGLAPAPIYLRVPPGHARHWARHCHRYNACGRPVYFVRDNWYNTVYVPRYRAQHEYAAHPYEAPHHVNHLYRAGYAPGVWQVHGPRYVPRRYGPRPGRYYGPRYVPRPGRYYGPRHVPRPGPHFGPGHLPGPHGPGFGPGRL